MSPVIARHADATLHEPVTEPPQGVTPGQFGGGSIVPLEPPLAVEPPEPGFPPELEFPPELIEYANKMASLESDARPSECGVAA